MDLNGEEVPINNASDSMATSYDVSLAEQLSFSLKSIRRTKVCLPTKWQSNMSHLSTTKSKS